MDKTEKRELYQVLRVLLENQRAIMNFLSAMNYQIADPAGFLIAKGGLQFQVGVTESELQAVDKVIQAQIGR